ncbi:MAG: penicillin-binding transpeptidase domain-containing protein [Tissierellales bacterium]
MNTESKRIIRILISLCGLFIGLVIYISYFQIFTADRILSNSYNKRQWIDEENILRGEIIDRKGTILVNSIITDKGQSRNYKYGNVYSHIIGYSSREYGKSGIEASYNKELLNLSDLNPLGELKNILSDGPSLGNNVVLTLDHELQSYAYKLLGNRKGSIVIMNPKTGEIYSMVSSPSFNPSTLKENWGDIIANENSPLLNRSIMGLYAPGSIFKLITATAAIENRESDDKFNCEGSINIDGYVLKDYGGVAHGELDLNEALVKSCNVAFSQIGLEIGDDKLRNTAEKYMFNRSIPFDLRTAESTFPDNIRSKPELGASAIGQGKILVTPLNMAMVASAIGNQGEMVKPIIVREIINHNNSVLKKYKTELLSKVTSPETAEYLKSMMIEVVNEGTGKSARLDKIQAAGKTGTAENESDKEHAWFIGFAPADDPLVAVAVIIESSGKTGGAEAAPIARDLMNRAIQILNK